MASPPTALKARTYGEDRLLTGLPSAGAPFFFFFFLFSVNFLCCCPIPALHSPPPLLADGHVAVLSLWGLPQPNHLL